MSAVRAREAEAMIMASLPPSTESRRPYSGISRRDASRSRFSSGLRLVACTERGYIRSEIAYASA
jgi:hypothetical protein